MKRRQFICGASAGIALCAGSTTAFSQGGNGIVRIILPFTPGGPLDVIARMLTESMSKTLGRTVIVDNRPGAGGLIGTRILQTAPQDANINLLMTYPGFVALPFMQKNANYDPLKDFVAVAGIAEGPAYVYVSSDVPARNMAEFIAWAKTVPGGVESATSGQGGASHISTLWLAKKTGINFVPVPYKGAGEQLTALIAGDCKIMIVNASQAITSQVAAGKLKLLGVASAKRSPLTPNVPTIAETIPGFVIAGWFGFVGQPKLPATEVASLTHAVKVALQEPGVAEKYAALFTLPNYQTPAEFSATLARSNSFYRDVFNDIGIKPQ